MATLETQQIDAVIDSSRRKMMALGGAAAALALVGIHKASAQATITDGDILNFALSLEFLGANYYSLGINGVTIDKLTAGSAATSTMAAVPATIPTTPVNIGSGGSANTGAGTVTTKVTGMTTGSGSTATPVPFPPVPFSTTIQDTILKGYFIQFLLDEIGHVATLSNALGSYAVAQPNIDLYNSFNAIAVASGYGASLDPFASTANFLLGAYIFEDTDTSAYHGAAPLITSKTQVLPVAVAIHAVEAYHAGVVRSSLAALDVANGNTNMAMATQQISALRATLTATQPSTAPAVTAGDVGLTTAMVQLEGSSASYPATTIVDADANSLAWARTTSQILAIVTNNNANGANSTTGAAHSGLFFPTGLNGVIS